MKRVIAYVHSHWDREWYRDFQEFRLRLIEVFNKILNELESGDLPEFYFDAQTAALEDFLEIFPEKESVVKQLIKDKKLYIGPFYCSTDSFLTSSESMIRNIFLGIQKSESYGCHDFIGYLADTFGHSQSMPRIFKHFDIDKAALWRGVPDLPADINWEKIKTTNLIQGYFQDFLSLDVPMHKKAEFLKLYLDKISQKSSDIILLPIGADHLATPSSIKNQVSEINKLLSGYQIELSNPFNYFELINDNDRVDVYGEFLNNSKTFTLPGVYSSRIYLKQQNAKIQWYLSRISEPFQAINAFAFNKESRQNQIDYAYKTLAKNHAHDSIYGCSIDKVHQDMMPRFSDVESLANGVEKRCIRDLSSSADTLKILNLSNYNYSGLVRIKTDKSIAKKYNPSLISKTSGFSDDKLYNISQIPITEDYTKINEYLIDLKNIPAFSICEIKDENICNESSISASDRKIENANISLEIINGKFILVDKKKVKIYSDFIKVTDRADIGDSYNFGPLKGDSKLVAKLVSHKLLEANEKRAIMLLTLDINIPQNSLISGRNKKSKKHTIKIKAILENQAEFIAFEFSWINKSKDHILQVEFNTNQSICKTLSEDMLGIVEREFDPEFDIYSKIPAPRGVEINPNTAPMQRFVWANGVGVITKGLNEYEVSKNNLSVTILRSTGVISNPKNPSRGTPAGPPIETPDLQCLGEYNAEFAVCFVENAVNLFRHAEEYYVANCSFFSDINDLNVLKVDNKNILLYAIKLSGKDLLVRLYNLSAQTQLATIQSDLSYARIDELNAKEIKIAECTTKIIFEPNQIKTIRLVKK